MFFFFRKPKLEVICYTDNSIAYEYYKIEQASKYIPKWFKDANSMYIDENQFHEPQSTIKKCPGIINLLTKGLILPLWTDINIYTDIVNNVIETSSADITTEIARHSSRQWDSYLNPDNYSHMKITSPWAFSVKDDTQFYWNSSFYNNKPDILHYIAPAIVDFKVQKATHINIFIPRISQHTILKAGFPIIQLIPLSDKKLVIKHELVDSNKMKQIHLKPHTFMDRYKTIVKLEKNKCPFHRSK